MLANAPRPPLIDETDDSESAHTFASVFGTRWHRTPVAGTYAIEADGVQFICRQFPGGGLDIGMYAYEQAFDFREAFNLKQLMEPICFRWYPQSMSPYRYLIQKMQERKLWRLLLAHTA